MALMQNIGAIRFREDLCYAEGNDDLRGGFGPFQGVGFHGGWRRRTCVKMKANRITNIDTVNGKKLIGIHVDGIPFVDKRNPDLLKDGGNSNEEANHEYLLGRFVEDRFVYRQSFVIRSYEIGPDKTATMETLMNLLQVGFCFSFS